MAKTVLFIGYDPHVEEEIEDYIKDKEVGIYFARGTDQIIQFLEDLTIHKVVLNLRNLDDAIILRYVNRYYPNIEVVVSTSREFEEVISILNQTNYSRLPSPFRLEELGSKL